MFATEHRFQKFWLNMKEFEPDLNSPEKRNLSRATLRRLTNFLFFSRILRSWYLVWTIPEFYDRLGCRKTLRQTRSKRLIVKAREKYPRYQQGLALRKNAEVQEAYETLSDDQKRSLRSVRESCGCRGGFGGAGGFGGLTERLRWLNIFKFFGVSEESAIQTLLVGRDDLQYRVNLTFEEAIFGTERSKYNREASCRTCNGSGAPGTSPVTLWTLSWCWCH